MMAERNDIMNNMCEPEPKKPHWFYHDMYHFNFYFCPEFTKQEYERAVNENFPGVFYECEKFADGTTTEIIMNDGRTAAFIHIKKCDDLSALVHECVHAAHVLMRHRGIKQDLNNDEPEAYLTEWIFQRCMDYSKVKQSNG